MRKQQEQEMDVGDRQRKEGGLSVTKGRTRMVRESEGSGKQMEGRRR